MFISRALPVLVLCSPSALSQQPAQLPQQLQDILSDRSAQSAMAAGEQWLTAAAGKQPAKAHDLIHAINQAIAGLANTIRIDINHYEIPLKAHNNRKEKLNPPQQVLQPTVSSPAAFSRTTTGDAPFNFFTAVLPPGANAVVPPSPTVGEPTVAQAFLAANIVPAMVDLVPQHTLNVWYPSGARLQQGNHLLPTETQQPPQLQWPIQPGKLYTVVMMDVSPHGEYQLYLHWLLVNVPDTQLAEADRLVDYQGPRPEVGVVMTGRDVSHNYVLTVFEQSGWLAPHQLHPFTPQTPLDKVGWPLKRFLRLNQLNPRPVAGNFFTAKAQQADVTALRSELAAGNG